MGTVYDSREQDWRTIERKGAEAVEGLELLPLEAGSMLDKERAEVGPGTVFTSEISEPHGIWAAADTELVLVAANVYPPEA